MSAIGFTVGCVGASPRGRRNHNRCANAIHTMRRISAWAEEPPCDRLHARRGPAHLRVGGGTLLNRRLSWPESGASPRGRRNLFLNACAPLVERRISAWAEEPAPEPTAWRTIEAHLRVGGGTSR